MTQNPKEQPPGHEPTATRLAETVDGVAETLLRALDEPDPEPVRREAERGAGQLRDVGADLRVMAVLDASRDEVLARQEEELKDIIRLMGQSIGELTRGNAEVASKLSGHLRELDQAAEAGSGEEMADRLRTIATGLRQAAAEVSRQIKTLATDVRGANERIATLEREVEEARQKALFDALTKIHSRAALDDQLADDLRNGEPPWCFVLIDIDHFKRINDRFGHLVGDALLYRLARTIDECVRRHATDAFLARYGGEEFAIILPHATLDEGARVAELIRHRVASMRWQLRDHADTVLEATVSLGVAEHRRGDSAVALINRTDAALYQAKAQGRNRVVVAEH